MGSMVNPESESSLHRVLSRGALITLSFSVGLLHYWHTSTMFEMDRNFSEISPLEREMSLRTEMGFYYYFYKTAVEEKLLLHGIARLALDRLVEYPDEVNAISRFNIYPEILSSGLHHYSQPWLQRWRSLRVEPIVFYLEVVWWCAGGTLSVLFLSAVALCGNTWGGLLSVAQYVANHAEATRVQWAPNERENFAQPFLLAQMALVTVQLRRPDGTASTVALQTAILVLNCISLLFWQFSQFILLTQLIIVFVMEQLCIISTRRLMLLLHSHFCGLHLAIMFTQGNDMLLTSLYTAFFAVISAYSLLLSSLRVTNIETRMDLAVEAWLIVIRISIVVTASLWVKSVMAEFMEVEDDSHILDILYSKFTNYKTFHTLLYTCSATFAFLPSDYFRKITETGLLPLVGISILDILHYWLFVGRDVQKEAAIVNQHKSKEKEIFVTDHSSGDDSGIEKSSVVNKQKTARRRRPSTNKTQKGSDVRNETVINRDMTNNELENKELNKDDTETDESVHNPNTDNLNSTIEEHNSAIEKHNLTKEREKRYHKLVLYLRKMDVDAGIFYNIAQMFVFGVMAVIIMRLKLLFTPHLCIVASLAAKPKYYCSITQRNKRPLLCLALFFATIACYNGYNNYATERSYIGDFSDPPLEELLRWISAGTPRDAVFAGPMPLASAVLLSTRRALVLHPHYEHHGLRQRAYAVYKTYGRFSPTHLHAELSKLKVTHLLVDLQNCYGKSDMGCTFEDIWDHEAPSLRGHPRLCHRLLTEDVPHFYKVFENERYAAFRVHDYRVRFTPRLLDT